MLRAELNKNHWRLESYKERMTIREWKELLLNKEDSIIFQGRVRPLIAESLGFGVVEVSKQSIREIP